jgi:uncharacterized membrane protein YqjE
MSETRYTANQVNNRTLAEVLAETRDEIKDFIQTRVQLLISELKEKAANSKKAAILGGIAAVLGVMAFLLLTLAVVGLIAVAFWGSPYAFFFAFLIVGVAYAMFAGMLAMGAIRQVKSFAPTKTIEVLKEDKVWLQSEARSQV